MAFFNVTPQAKYEALYPVLTQEADQTARQRETAASWYEGVGTSVVNGLKSGYYRDLFATAQATGEADLQQKALQAIQDNKPDPTTTGAVGQVLHGFGEQVALAAYSFSGGDITPNLMAMRTGVSYSASQQAIHEKEGMDPATAQSVARTEGAGVGLGLALPAAVPGKLLARAASGAGINAVTGMGQRAIISDTLRKAGYDDMAKQYEVLDGTALATDIALGAFFGGLLGPRGKRIDVPPSTADAALVARQQMHMEVDSAPGIPTNTRSRNAHVAAMDASMDALARGERVDVEPIIRGSEFADKPIPEGVDLESVIRAELDRVGARDVIDSLRRLETEAQARGIAVEADALPEVPKRTEKLGSMQFKDEMTGSGYGQSDHSLLAIGDDGAVVGKVDYSVFDGRPSINMIEVPAEFRRKSIGSELVKQLQRKFPDSEIEWGMMTEDGAALRKSLRTVAVETENAKLFSELKKAIEERDRLISEAEEFRKIKNPSAQQKEAHWKNVEPLNDLHDKIYDLEKELDGQSPTKSIIDTGVDSATTDAKLQPPEVENPSMTIPDETGKPVLAADAMASADAEVKQAAELSKVFDVAVECATRFGQ